MSTETPPKPQAQIVADVFSPAHTIPLHWFQQGFKRQDKAIIGALLAAWTGLPFAMYLAAVGFFVGAVFGLLGASATSAHLGVFGTVVGSPGGGLLGMLVGAILGAVGGFIFIYYLLVTHPLQLAGALVGGVIVSLLVLWSMDAAEPALMRARGYRKPSRRERQKIDPLLQDIGARMGFPTVPDWWVSESKKPGAWMHLRAFVLSRGLLGDYDASEEPPKPDLDDDAIAAIITHELNHWQMGDVVGLTMIAACFFPFVCITNGIQWIRLRAEWTGVILWCFLWPIWVCSRLVVVPLMAANSRLSEFQADRRAARLGDQYRLGMRRALTELSNWEVARTGWEEVLSATHPPTELRLERLEDHANNADSAVVDSETTASATRPRKRPSEPVAVTKPPAKVAEPVAAAPKPRKPRQSEPIGLEDEAPEDDGRWS